VPTCCAEDDWNILLDDPTSADGPLAYCKSQALGKRAMHSGLGVLVMLFSQTLCALCCWPAGYSKAAAEKRAYELTEQAGEWMTHGHIVVVCCSARVSLCLQL
jgi:hypothetical protein